jgi:hypothetical protein
MYSGKEAQELVNASGYAKDVISESKPYNAQGYYEDVWIKEHSSDPGGDWPMRFAEAYAQYRLNAFHK